MHMFYNITPNDEGMNDEGGKKKQEPYWLILTNTEKIKQTNRINAYTTYTRVNRLHVGYSSFFFCLMSWKNKRNT